jgi:integrase/recombinase XerC
MHHLLENFLNHLQFERHYSSHTLLAYQTDLEQFFDFLYRHFETPSLSESMLTQVDVLTVRLWMGELLEQGMQARSIGRKLAAVRSFLGILFVSVSCQFILFQTSRHPRSQSACLSFLPKSKPANFLTNNLRL